LALFFSIRITETKERATLEKLVEKEVSACGFFIRPETQSLIVEIYEMANRI
jgi:hypothetical protein